MFFIISKTVGLLVQPANLLAIISITALLIQFSSHHKTRKLFAFLALLSWIAVGYHAVPEMLYHKLETAHPAYQGDGSQLKGVIVLGGSFDDGKIADEQGQAQLNASAERLTVAISLARQNTDLKLVFAGFGGSLSSRGWSESEMAAEFFNRQGIDPDRLIFENRSRNTYENIVNVKTILDGNEGQFGLITSAGHMPRAMAIAEKAGIADRLSPIPVDFRTRANPNWVSFDVRHGLQLWDVWLHEAVGTLLYRMTGRL
ncbi:MAG: YdcF family protein [Pseudomonadota bacterium]